MPRYLNNEAANQVALFATEVNPGVPVSPTATLRGEWTASLSRALERSEEATGRADRFVTPRRQRAEPSGSYSETGMSFESFAYLTRYGLAGGGVGIDQGDGAFLYSRAPGAIDDIDAMTVVSGIEGLAHQASGVRWNEFTISGSAVDTSNPNWQFSGTPHISQLEELPGNFTGVVTAADATTVTMTGAGWTVDEWVGAWVGLDFGTNIGEMRRVLSNTEDTLTLEDPPLEEPPAVGSAFHLAAPLPIVVPVEEEIIPVEGTKLFLDPYVAGGLLTGTTDISERIVSFSVSVSRSLTAKHRLPGRIARVGVGTRIISGTIRFEDDRWDERHQLRNNDFLSLRIQQDGSEISEGVDKYARIDANKIVWDTGTPDVEGSNMTHSLSFLAYLPVGTPDPIAKMDALIALPELP